MNNSALDTFHFAARELPYYKQILVEKSVDVKAVKDFKSFTALVPILSKDEIFGKFSASEISPQGKIPDFASAIVSSGTSGTFSFALITRDGIDSQRQSVDSMMDQFFDAKNNPPLIINLLALGVSFVSSYPVVPTSVRTDIALQVIKNFGQKRQIILIGDPHVIKKLLDEGVKSGLNWLNIQVSVIVGGIWFSDSYAKYVLDLLNGSVVVDQQQNHLFSTLGVTEVGLNIFAATPELVFARSALNLNEEARRVLSDDSSGCPILMYQLSEEVLLEVVNQDLLGVGDLVVTHLKNDVTPCLIRYQTGDRVKLIRSEELVKFGLTNLLPLPVYAIYGREKVAEAGSISEAQVKEIIYKDKELSHLCTGHFIIKRESDDKVGVQVQLKPNVSLICTREIESIQLNPLLYHDFERDMELSYEVKWKHLE